ncbi:MAG: hypothetical protein WC845_02845 [Candidatus Staskawiczbacteria bacterium]|jgi:cytochrome c oxidase subunit 2
MQKLLNLTPLFIVGILIFGFALNQQNIGAADANTPAAIISRETKEFDVRAFRFGYAPNQITVNKGDLVKIRISNTDTLHGIRIPSLNIRGNDVISFIASRSGEFTWYCNTMCGSGHENMQGKLVVK